MYNFKETLKRMIPYVNNDLLVSQTLPNDKKLGCISEEIKESKVKKTLLS